MAGCGSKMKRKPIPPFLLPFYFYSNAIPTLHHLSVSIMEGFFFACFLIPSNPFSTKHPDSSFLKADQALALLAKPEVHYQVLWPFLEPLTNFSAAALAALCFRSLLGAQDSVLEVVSVPMMVAKAQIETHSDNGMSWAALLFLCLVLCQFSSNYNYVP